MRGVVVGLVVLVATVSRALSPPVVGWREAAGLVGGLVTVEGEVTAVRVLDGGFVLEFSDEPDAFRIEVLVPLFGDAPRDPEGAYRGHRVRATGRVQTFQGRPEIVLRAPSQIEIVNAPAAAARVGETPASPPPSPAPPPPPPPPARPVERPLGDAAPCERARASWRDAAADVQTRLAALGQCLDRRGYRCGAERAALVPALGVLEEIERGVDAACR
jgi:hypothetical protein